MMRSKPHMIMALSKAEDMKKTGNINQDPEGAAAPDRIEDLLIHAIINDMNRKQQKKKERGSKGKRTKKAGSVKRPTGSRCAGSFQENCIPVHLRSGSTTRTFTGRACDCD